MEKEEIIRQSRRSFLANSGKSLALLMVANAGLYVVGSAFKKLDGSLVAGAKWCECKVWSQNGFCGYTGITTSADYYTIDVVGSSCSGASCSTGTSRVSNCRLP